MRVVASKSFKAPARAFLLAVSLLAGILPHSSPFVAVAASRQPVRARHAMVASDSRIASQVGVDIMRRGGNAVDAAVAVALALAVVYPEAGNLGGGGFMLIRLKDRTTAAIDYREMAPSGAHRDLFINKRGELIQGEGSSRQGYRASGVPGTVAGLSLALNKYGSGKLTWAQLAEPARKLAAEGFPLTRSLATTFRDNSREMLLYPESRRIFLNNGRFFEEGTVFRQPELALTLARLQRHGPREFYEGRTAQLIAAEMKRHRGLITELDLKNYAPSERVPLRSTYRGHEVISMPPPSSGGVVLLEMLNILEGYDLRKFGWSSAETFHVMTESMRRAYADRAAYLADPDHADVPTAALTAKNYAAKRRETIKSDRATASAEIGGGKPAGRDPGETTHFSVVDADGNVVANTYTINDLFGSGVTVTGTGILMNDEMDDFTARPGTPNRWGAIQGEQNSVAPRKRPLSSMTPTIVLHKDGSVWFAVGARGGTRIINAVLQIVVNVVDFDMNIQQALDSPRIHHQWLPDVLLFEAFGMSPDTRRILEDRGHKVEPASDPLHIAAANAIMIEAKTGIRLGAGDPRKDGGALGY